MKKVIASLLIGFFAMASVFAQAKIGMNRAKLIALAKVKGKIISSELEREKGQMVYSFDIRNRKGGITEILINAYSGKVVEVKKESAAAEVKEKIEDAKKKKNQR